MSHRLFRALDGSSRSSIPSQHSRDSTLKTFRPPQRRLERLRVEGSSKLRKLCARWAVIAAKTLVMMTLSAVFLSVLPIKNLYKAAAKLPVYKAKTAPVFQPPPLNKQRTRAAQIDIATSSTSPWPCAIRKLRPKASLASFPADKMQH